MTDYFNFGLDENNWRSYCKQLEQLRLEATMQSKIRVYESGRSDQDYDPDLPPELAAAAGLHDGSADLQPSGKVDGGQSDIMGHGRGSIRVRPPIPTGKAIQVEGGYGERLPSIDTRPPRHRDSDAIIEIVLQGSVDDDSVGDTQGKLENELQEADYKDEHLEVKGADKQSDVESFGNFSQPYGGRRRDLFVQQDFVDPLNINVHGEPFSSEANLQYHSVDKGQTTMNPVGVGAPPSSHRDRWSHGAAVKERHSSISSDVLPTENVEMNRSSCSGKEHSEDSEVPKESTEVSYPEEDVAGSKQSLTIEEPDSHVDTLVDSVEVEGEVSLELQVPNESSGDGSSVHSARRQKLNSRIEQPVSEDHSEEMKTNRSDDSKLKPGSSKDHLRRRDSGDEVIQNGRPSHIADAKRHYLDEDSGLQRRDDYVRGGRQDVDRSRASLKGREDYHHRSSSDAYPHKEWDGNSSYHARNKTEAYDRLKERNSLTWQRRDDDAHTRRQKEDESRREKVEDASSKLRSRALESGRNSKERHAHLKKRYEDGDWRGYHDKEVRKSRERDVLLSRQHDNVDDPHAKRRKETELHRRDRPQKEDVGHSYGNKEDLSRRRRDRDDSLERRRREDPGRMRDKPDDQHLIRRDSNRRQREREDRHRMKPSHEDTQVNRDREARAPVRSGQISEDQIRLGNSRIESRAKDEPGDSGKDHKRRHSELPKGRDKVEEESYLQHKSREDLHGRDDNFSGASESQHSYRERSKERPKKGNESEMSEHDIPARGDRDAPAPTTADKPGKAAVGKRKLDDRSTSQRKEKATKKGSFAPETDNGLRRVQKQETTHQQLSLKSQRRSDDEGMWKGRSKLERWTSHKDNSSTPTLKAHDSETSFSDHNHEMMVEQGMSKEDDFKRTQVTEKVEENIATIVAKESAVNTFPLTSEHGHADHDANGDDKHLETVAKLKKRSERFKLPMPNEKEIGRRVESESSAQMETTEVKQERPARKRRWVNN